VTECHFVSSTDNLSTNISPTNTIFYYQLNKTISLQLKAIAITSTSVTNTVTLSLTKLNWRHSAWW